MIAIHVPAPAATSTHQDRSQRNKGSAATAQSLWFLAHCF